METDLIKRKDKNGREYTVRKDPNRIFYPGEWKLFLKGLRDKNKFLFEFQFNTGCRIDEALYIRPCDFDFERNNVRLWKTKTKARKGETYGKPRTISISSKFSKRMKMYCNKFGNEDKIFKGSAQSVGQLLKRVLKKIGIKDYYNFASHNIRKTHGMYLKALGIDSAEICTRLGHDYATYLKHYGSADTFSEKDMTGIRELLDDLYFRQRRF